MELVAAKWGKTARLVVVAQQSGRLTHCCSAFHAVSRRPECSTHKASRRQYSVLVRTGCTTSSPGILPHRHTLHLSRHKSDVPAVNTGVSEAGSATPYIPEPPAAEVTDVVVEQLNALGEPTLSSLGLCSYYPPGWVQSLLENIHVTTGLPWWGTLVTFAVGLRLCILPLQIYATKVSVKQQNVMPKFMELQGQLEAAAGKNDIVTAQILGLKLETYRKKNDVKLWKSGISMAYQAPIFISVMTAIRGMSRLPVPSLTEGGAAWFPDLTIPDPYFLLPMITATTLLLAIEVGADGLRSKNLTTRNKWVVRGFVLIGTPAIMAFNPAALGVYWLTSNIMAVSLNAVIKTPAIKKWLEIPDIADPSQNKFSKPITEGFFQQIKRMTKEKKIRNVISDRESITSRAFDDASRAKIVKTYKVDPTKNRPLA